MEGIGRAAQEEFNKSVISVAQGFDARMEEKAKDQTIPSKSAVNAKLPPCLNFGADDRNLGAGSKTEKPPATQSGRKMEIGANSISTETEKPTKQLKTEQTPEQWETRAYDPNVWWGGMSYYDWFGPSEWGKSRPIPQPKGNYARGESHHRLGQTLKLILDVRHLETSNGLWR